LEDLPLPALTLIYQHLDATTRKSVLRVSRWGRDLVLREVKAVSLEMQSSRGLVLRVMYWLQHICGRSVPPVPSSEG
jgi:hypothetical protein